MKKKLVLIAAGLMTALTLYGCGGSSTPSKDPGENPTEQKEAGQEAPEGENKAQVVISIGYVNNPGEPIDLACQEWARLLEEKTGGEMKLELYPSSQLDRKSVV